MHVEVHLGKILNPKLLPISWSAPGLAATAISVWITASRFGQKLLINAIMVVRRPVWGDASVFTNRTDTGVQWLKLKKQKQNFLELIIHWDQSYVRDLWNMCQLYCINVWIISLDQVKACDRTDRGFLYSSFCWFLGKVLYHCWDSCIRKLCVCLPLLTNDESSPLTFEIFIYSIRHSCTNLFPQ